MQLSRLPPKQNYMIGDKRGFTLIELIVAIAVFVFVVSSASGLLISGLKLQRRSIVYQQLLDQTSYLSEYVSRAARMARKDIAGLCLTTAGAKYNYETNVNRDRIRFLNYQNKCQEFLLTGAKIQERKSTNSSAANFETPQDLTSEDFQVTFRVGASDSWDQLDDQQPRLTLFFDVVGKENSRVKIQTTVSQRSLDVKR